VSGDNGKPDSQEKKKLVVSIKTFGCQMNDFDSELAAGLLQKEGHVLVEDAREADVILFNTCSVRQHAEDRVFNQLAELKGLKRKRPEVLIGVMGCMVENYRDRFFTDYPHVDILIGTRSVRELPRVIERGLAERKQILELAKTGFGYELYEFPRIEGKIHAYLPIMTGCDKVCSFCVVPYVRGREISRPPGEVIDQVKRFVDSGVKHVTLLGQNVNSYASKLDEKMNFAGLLRETAKVDGIEKIGFTTSHPQDASEELFCAIRDVPKISRRFHLPLQSGADRVLSRMKRDHTLAEYRTKIDRMRELIPDVAVTTDIIVGFPGETEEDYECTKRALRDIDFDGAFIFKYSPRPHTAAARWEDATALAEKNRRNRELLDLQKEITRRRNEAFLGETVRVLVEDRSKKDPQEMLARTWQEKKVVFQGSSSQTGSCVSVRLLSVADETFRAVPA
jgi:tRNA-2-methylthio-N6-dimethylallyladenosine synthase